MPRSADIQSRFPKAVKPLRGIGIDELASMQKVVESGLGLSPTQALVALGIWRGLKEKQIAEWLEKQPGTIHSHIQDIYQRCLKRGRHDRVAVAVRVERVLSTAGSVDDDGKGW